MNLKINYQVVDSVKNIIPNINDHIVFDTETTGLETHNPETKIIGVGLTWAPGQSAYLDLNTECDRKLKEFEELILNNPKIEKWGQNYKYDIRILTAHGHKYCNLKHDSSLLSYCLYGDRNSVGSGDSYVGGHGLDELSLYNFNFIKIRTKSLIPKKSKKNKNPSMLQAPQDKVATYCMEDTDFTYRSIVRLLEYLESNKNARDLYYNIELPVYAAIIKMELDGVHIDVKKTLEIKQKMLDIQTKAIQHISDLIGEPIKITDRNQIEDIVFNKLKLQDSKENVKLKPTKTGISVDKKTLEQFKDNEFVSQLLVAKALEKNIGTYLEDMPNLISPIDGMIHGSFNQTITTTGRLSANNPNLQNIPTRTEEGKLIRSVYSSRFEGGKILSADYSQCEIRILAHMSGEPIFIDAYAANKDVHTYVASLLYNTDYDKVTKDQRTPTKCIDPKTIIKIIDNSEEKYVRIGSLLKNNKVDEFINLNTKVYNGKEYVNTISSYNAGLKASKLIISSYGSLICSNEHLFSINQSLVKAKDLKLNDILDIPLYKATDGAAQKISYNPIDYSKNGISSIEVSEELAYFAGMFLGDGCCSSHTVNIAVGKPKEYEPWKQEIIKNLTSLGFKTKQVIGKTSIALNFGSRKVARFIALLELVKPRNDNFTKNFHVPITILNSPKKIRLQFIAGLIDTDGTVVEQGQCNICTKDAIFASEIVTLIRSIGAGAYITVAHNKLYNRNYYKVNLQRDAREEIRSYLRCYWKKDRLNAALAKKSIIAKCKKPENKILEIKDLGNKQLVDISIDSKDHLYITNNLITHNTINFGLIYGMGIDKLMAETGMTREAATAFIEAYLNKLNKVDSWIKETREFLRRNGYTETLFGRRRYLPEIYSSKKYKQEAAEREGTNHPVQGTNADITKLAMISIHKELLEKNMKSLMILQVHDELVFDVHPTELVSLNEIVMRIMPNVVKLKVPLVCEAKIGQNWTEAH